MGSRRQDALCFFCDYGLIIFGVLLVVLVWFLRIQIGQAASLRFEPTQVAVSATLHIPTEVGLTSESVTSPPQILTQVGPTSQRESHPPLVPTLINEPFSIPEFTPTPGTFQSTPSVISTPKVMPEFVIVFIPLKWVGTADAFSMSANEQADIFIKASNIDHYFRVQVKILDKGLNQVSLSDDELLDKVIEFGLKTYPADRYVGLTDGDLTSGDSSWIAGWTYGPGTLGVVAESNGREISAHELGHTFGLCDEYNYAYWKVQNETFADGCPNPYPTSCTRDEIQDGITCEGNPPAAGMNSLMGPAGMFGQYGFNNPSLEYLHEKFQSSSGG